MIGVQNCDADQIPSLAYINEDIGDSSSNILSMQLKFEQQER